MKKTFNPSGARFGLVGAALAALVGLTETAKAEPMIGEIRAFPYNWCPRGWAEAAGQLLPISQNTALFSLYGTTYGGDGRSTFALPDLRGRTPINNGRGPGLTERRLGARGGQETVTLLQQQMPAHNHNLFANSGTATTNDPTNSVASTYNHGGGARVTGYGTGSGTTPMKNTMVGNTGGGLSHENRAPYIAVNYCVSLLGLYPSRS